MTKHIEPDPSCDLCEGEGVVADLTAEDGLRRCLCTIDDDTESGEYEEDTNTP